MNYLEIETAEQDENNAYNAAHEEMLLSQSDDDYAILMAEHEQAYSDGDAEFDAMMARNRYGAWLADNGLTEGEHECMAMAWCDRQD